MPRYARNGEDPRAHQSVFTTEVRNSYPKYLYSYHWEQTENIVTLYLIFNGEVLFRDGWGTYPLTYEHAKDIYKDIDWENWAAYTIDFTLDWDTGRQFIGIPIRPSDAILAWYSNKRKQR